MRPAPDHTAAIDGAAEHAAEHAVRHSAADDADRRAHQRAADLAPSPVAVRVVTCARRVRFRPCR
jgi:hypothetical protein